MSSHGRDTAEPRPDGFLVAVERRLRAVLDYLVETDFAVANAADFESQLRQERRAATRELAFLLVALRRLVIAQFEDPDLANLALEPVNVRDTPTILARAVLVGERFEAQNLARMLGRQRFEVPIDLEPYVAQIQDKAARLAALSEEVNEAQRATDRARITRKRAKEEYDRVYLRGARMFEDMCRFAGLDELASAVRRRTKRAASTEVVDEVPGQVDPVVEDDRDGENSQGTAERREDGISSPKELHPSAQGKRSAACCTQWDADGQCCPLSAP